jgi:hypothetical protein
MLIVGEAARKQSLDDIKVLEVICKSEQINHVLNHFNIESHRFKYMNKISTFYQLNNKGKMLIIHNASTFLPLHQLLVETFATGYNYKICNVIVQAAIDYARLLFTHKEITTWQESMEFYTYINEKYLQYLDQKTKYHFNRRINMLKGWVISDNHRYISKVYKYSRHVECSSTTLFNLYRRRKDSVFLQLFDEEEDYIDLSKINYNTWDHFSDMQKTDAIAELISVQTTHDEIMPYYLIRNSLPKVMLPYLLISYMNLVSSNLGYKIINYAIANFNNIMEEIDNQSYNEDTTSYFKYGVLNY